MLKKILRYVSVFILYWVIYGILFLPCLMYRNYLSSLDYSMSFLLSNFVDYIVASMLFFLYPLFFAFLISLFYCKKKKVVYLVGILFCLCFPYNFIFYRECAFFIICSPFVFWFYYFKYLKRRECEI